MLTNLEGKGGEMVARFLVGAVKLLFAAIGIAVLISISSVIVVVVKDRRYVGVTRKKFPRPMARIN